MSAKNSFRALFTNCINLLVASRTTYVLIGGVASDIWGRPRKTLDIDMVLHIQPEKYDEFLSSAREYGFAFSRQKALKQLTDMGMCRLFYGDYHADFIMGYSEFEHIVFDRKKKVRMFNRDIYVASPEDVILYKLISHRPIDQSDMANIVAAQGTKLDRHYLRTRVSQMQKELNRADIKSNLDKLLG